MTSATLLFAAAYGSLERVDVSDPLWFAGWGAGLIALALVSRAIRPDDDASTEASVVTD